MVSRWSASGRGRTTACRVLRSSFKSSSTAKKGVTMAVAVDFRGFTPVDARIDLIKKLERAPAEHAEAVLNHVVGLISSPTAITATRLGLMMVNTLGSIDADKISAALAAGEKEPP